MLPAGRGVIVNIGSLFAAVGMPRRAACAASKHGVIGLTKVLATEWAARGIRVVAFLASDDASFVTGSEVVGVRRVVRLRGRQARRLPRAPRSPPGCP